MTIQYLDAQQRPLSDAVVSIASSPGSIQDIAMVTDANGAISFDVADAGEYIFNVAQGGQTHVATAHLQPGAAQATVLVGGGAAGSSNASEVQGFQGSAE